MVRTSKRLNTLNAMNVRSVRSLISAHLGGSIIVLVLIAGLCTGAPVTKASGPPPRTNPIKAAVQVSTSTSTAAATCLGWDISFPYAGPGDYGGGSLDGLAVVSADDIWAVGFRELASPVEPHINTGGRVEHWDGTRWNVVPGPVVQPITGTETILNDISKVSAQDLWAVGYLSARAGTQTLVAHWNGTRWDPVQDANVGLGSSLSGVHAVAADDVWAVGYYTTEGGATEALTEHWDGQAWQVVPNPATRFARSELLSVAGTASNDMWAVGTYKDSAPGASQYAQALIMHWDGTQWSTVSSPAVQPGETGDTTLAAVASIAPDVVWPVGYRGIVYGTYIHL